MFILGASVVLVFSIGFFGFVCCSIWLHIITLDWERDTLRFHCREHSSFHSIHPASVLYLRVLRLAFYFMFVVRFSNEWCSWIIYDVLSGLK